MDNALKHSVEKKVFLTYEGQKLVVSNKGEPLKMAIEEYFQPFVSGSKACGSSLGLGLYIVSNIMALHGLSVHYDYIDGYHQFSLDFSKGKYA